MGLDAAIRKTIAAVACEQQRNAAWTKCPYIRLAPSMENTRRRSAPNRRRAVVQNLTTKISDNQETVVTRSATDPSPAAVESKLSAVATSEGMGHYFRT